MICCIGHVVYGESNRRITGRNEWNLPTGSSGNTGSE